MFNFNFCETFQRERSLLGAYNRLRCPSGDADRLMTISALTDLVPGHVSRYCGRLCCLSRAGDLISSYNSKYGIWPYLESIDIDGAGLSPVTS